MKNFFKNPLKLQNIFPITIIAIGIFLAIKNYTPNTFLTGWDTLHPEFNFAHSLNSVIWGAWRSDQGLGAIAAHSHMAELPRIIFLWLSSLIFPLNTLRYLYFFFCLILGPVGMYFLVSDALVFRDHKIKFIPHAAGFAGALYYLLNLGTLQQFFVPFEMFATHFAFLPWILLLACKFIKSDNKKLLIVLGVLSFLAAPQAYAATLFYAFILCLGVILLFFSLLLKGRKHNLKNAFLVMLVLFITNAFWILPNLYSIKNQSEEIEKSNINSLFSPEAFLHNERWGTLDNIVQNKNFLFSWREFDFSQNKFVDLLNEWNSHLDHPQIKTLSWAIVIMALAGAVMAIYKKDKTAIALLPALAICLFFLINSNPPTGFLFDFIRNHFPILEEAMRTPFTKFSIFFTLIMGYFFAHFFYWIIRVINRIKSTIIIPIVFAILVTVAMVIFMLPAFRGNLISPSMRVDIPKQYFEMYDWFDQQPDNRVATLPMYTFWGWKYHTWGYQGAGFLWFGLNQPVMERDFDRWNPDNETFYLEASNAIYEGNKQAFENILAKYQIGYLVFDTSEFNAGADSDVLKLSLLKEWLNNSQNIKKVKEFDFITVYQTPWGENKIASPSQVSFNDTDTTYAPYDSLDYQNQVIVKNNKSQIYPFINLDNRLVDSSASDGNLTLAKNINLTGDYQLNIPDLIRQENQMAVNVYGKINQGRFEVTLILRPPVVSVDSEPITLEPVKYIYNFPLKNKTAKYLSINQQVFKLDNINSEQLTLLGSAQVPTNKNTIMAVYSDEEVAQVNFEQELKSHDASWCKDSDKIVDFQKNANGLTLTAEDESVCIGNGLSMPAEGLSIIKFDSSGSVYPFVCINAVGIDGCLNNNQPFFYKQNGSWRQNTFLTPLNSGQYWLAWVVQAQEKGRANLNLQNINVDYLPQLARFEVNLADSFGLFYKDRQLLLTDPKTISIELPLVGLTSEDFNLRRGYAEAKNCDLYKLGEVEKNWGDSLVEYFADNDGISCDYFDYGNIDNTKGYYLHISGDNDKGRSIKLYIQNQAETRISDEILLPSGVFDSLTYLPAANTVKSGGYVVNIEDKSFGRLEARNSLNKISFIPIPNNWLANLSVVPLPGFNEGIITNNVKLTTSGKTGLYYSAQVQSDEDGGIITISQGYESGWKAYIKNGLNITPLKHVEANSWANGWVLPQGESNIVIFYFPQLLEWLGLGLIALTLPIVYAILRNSSKD